MHILLTEETQGPKTVSNNRSQISFICLHTLKYEGSKNTFRLTDLQNPNLTALCKFHL